MSPLNRRDALKALAATGIAALPNSSAEATIQEKLNPGWVIGCMSGAKALTKTLQVEGTRCVFGIPGAQENELWDAFKSLGLPYLLVTHEQSAAYMADGYARSTGHPGVICLVPGPGVTNALSGIGEALLDSVPMVCIVGDVARGEKYKPFQVHELPNVELLRPVTKGVFPVQHGGEIPQAVRHAFALARSGEPGPTAVVVPYNLLMEVHKYRSSPIACDTVPFDEPAFQHALHLLSQRKHQVGIYAGMGCMKYAPLVAKAAEILQAPVATTVSGKGVIDERHPLAVGWGYGPQGTETAEKVFKHVDVVLAIGARYSEVSTAFYNIPKTRHHIHVDINKKNLGRIVKPSFCVHSDAGVFLEKLIGHSHLVARAHQEHLHNRIKRLKAADLRGYHRNKAKHGVDPMAFLMMLRHSLRNDGLLFVDVTLTEHWAAEAFRVVQPRTYFNPTDNQSMGWSIPAAIGAQYAHPGREVATVTGDGCMMMTAMEMATAAKECLPVKFFVLDDQAYHYMQVLQKAAYRRTTATILPRVDYCALAKALGLGYVEILHPRDLKGGIASALHTDGPVLIRVGAEYGKREVRWIDATRERFTEELSPGQMARFAARIGARTLQIRKQND